MKRIKGLFLRLLARGPLPFGLGVLRLEKGDLLVLQHVHPLSQQEIKRIAKKAREQFGVPVMVLGSNIRLGVLKFDDGVRQRMPEIHEDVLQKMHLPNKV